MEAAIGGVIAKLVYNIAVDITVRKHADNALRICSRRYE